MNSIDQLKVRPQRDDSATFTCKSTLFYVQLLNEVRQDADSGSRFLAAHFASLERLYMYVGYLPLVISN